MIKDLSMQIIMKEPRQEQKEATKEDPSIFIQKERESGQNRWKGRYSWYIYIHNMLFSLF